MVILGDNNLLNKKYIFYQNLRIKGINKYLSFFFFKKMGISLNILVSFNNIDFNEYQLYFNDICNVYNIYINNRLNGKIYNFIKVMIISKNYRGYRHKNNMPVRGQGTHSNARTVKRCNFKTFFKAFR